MTKYSTNFEISIKTENVNTKNRKYMDNLTLYPTNIKSVKDEEIQYYKDNIHNIIVAPFNSSEWSN